MMLLNILIGIGVILAVAVVAVLVLAAMKPDETVITRSATMNAPPERPFEQVNNLQNWGAWNPWAKMDPHQKITFSGPEAGVGARFAWSGNNKVGEGNIEIIESEPSERLKIRLEFLKPMAATNTAEFTFTPEGSGTRMTWSMICQGTFMAKVFTVFMDMDKMVGPEFEKGMADIKAIVEATQ